MSVSNESEVICLLNDKNVSVHFLTFGLQSTLITTGNLNAKLNLTILFTLAWHSVYKEWVCLVLFLATPTSFGQVPESIFPLVIYSSDFSDKKMNAEKWPELGSGQKYVTLPYCLFGFPYVQSLCLRRSWRNHSPVSVELPFRLTRRSLGARDLRGPKSRGHQRSLKKALTALKHLPWPTSQGPTA